MCSEGAFAELLQGWGLEFERSRPGIGITGSPDRSLFRVVVETGCGSLFVLERVDRGLRDRKARIAAALAELRDRGLEQVLPYLRDGTGAFVREHPTGTWMLSPYVRGVALPRPGYGRETWRAAPLVDFLAGLRRASASLPNTPTTPRTPPFSPGRFVADLRERLRRFDPEVHRRVAPVAAALEASPALERGALPTAFCHGDYHPLNVIWSPSGISAVIDWEFVGTKPEAYDLATLVGCIGVEDPAALTGGLILEIVERTRGSGLVTPASLTALPALVLAIRFAWLSDWLRRRDAEMVDLEVTYIRLLADHAGELAVCWGLGRDG